MRSWRVRPALPAALVCLMLFGCVDWGKELLRAVLGARQEDASEPVPPGARRATSREEIVCALVPGAKTKSGPRIVATLEEVVDACPSFARRMKQWQEDQANARRFSSANETCSCPPWTPADLCPEAPVPTMSDDVVRLAELTVHVETGDRIVSVKLSEPVEANGCLYGYLESGTCRSLGE